MPTSDNLISTSTSSYGVTTINTSSIFTTLRLLSISPNVTCKALSRPTYYIYNRLGMVGGLVSNYQSQESSNYT
jgi:hypothetical protein